MVNAPDAPFVESDFQYNADGLRTAKTVSVASSAAPKDGLYRDADGEIRYYDNGFASYAGLILVNGNYYYIRSNYVAARNCSYAISVNNGLLPLGTYTFDADGKMVNPPTDAAVGTVVNASYAKSSAISLGYVFDEADTTVYQYHYVGDTLAGLTCGTDELYFTYDVLGPSAVIYNGTTYYYTRNAQGDITGIVDSNGVSKVAYTYDAWGNPLTTTGTMASTLGALNPLRYRGYVFDSDSNLYYLQSRYYSPSWGRFICSDQHPSTGQGLSASNMFAYCGNNPVCRKDEDGEAFETVFDIISLGCSIADVAVNPANPWAWLSLIGDVADVAIPFVGGLGEAVRVLKSKNLIDDAVDVAEITKNTLEAISAAAHAASSGGEFVYTAYTSDQSGILEYVGITNDFDRREGEWRRAKDRKIRSYISGVDRDTARYAEQTIITLFGRSGDNSLSNIRNSIGKKGRLNSGYLNFFSGFFN